MNTWFEAGTYCEEIYGVDLDTKEGYFICADCGEPIYKEDWREYDDWAVCPICGFNFLEG